jgi:hypothetical protein
LEVCRFDLLALADIRRFANGASLPADEWLTAEMGAFAEAVARPATQSIVTKAAEQGFQQRSDLELNFGAYIEQSLPTRALCRAHERERDFRSRLIRTRSEGRGCVPR